MGSIAAILYYRTSTAEQIIEHQADQARQAGFKIDEILSDPGLSGVSTKLAERPQGRRLFDKLRSGDTLVVRWVDRLGRDYNDVTSVIREFMELGVTIKTVINSMTFDGLTKDPIQMAVRDAVIGFMAASAQSQAEVTKEVQTAGIALAKNKPHKYRGRKPSYDREKLVAVLELLQRGVSGAEISRNMGLTRQPNRADC